MMTVFDCSQLRTVMVLEREPKQYELCWISEYYEQQHENTISYE